VRINVLQCPDLATLAAKLASETYSLPGGTWRRARHAVPEFLRRFRVTPIITFDEGGHPTFLFSPGLSGPRADELVADVYAICRRSARSDRPPLCSTSSRPFPNSVAPPQPAEGARR